LLAGLNELRGDLVDLLVQRIGEMLGLEEAGDPVHGLVVDENGAEQGLLGFDVVRRLPELQRLVGRRLGTELVGREKGCLRHAREASRSNGRRGWTTAALAAQSP